MTQDYKHLFSPMPIGNTFLKNRIEASPISLFDLSTTPDRHPSKEDEGFYRIRAMGGAALVTIGDGIIHPTGVDSGYLASPKIMMCDDDNIPFITALCDEIHRSDALACMQLNHAGMLSTTANFSGWGPDDIDFSKVIMTSALADQNGDGQADQRHGIVQGMSEDMIETIVEGFADSARRAQICGFDMVQVHAAHGWLIHQFLSPLTNHRTDRFGGSIENRARLLCMIVERIRAYCGRDLLINVRISGTEFVEGGYPMEDIIQVVKMIDANIDYLHVSAGNFAYPETECRMIPSFVLPEGHLVYLAAEIKKHVKCVVSTVSGILDPDMMEDIVASGKADMVAISRALIADPHFPNKVKRGQLEEIRPCIRCAFCIANYQMRVLRCSVNPTIHRPWEELLPQRTPTPRKVLIAGGGPGGMEAAITAKERGHEVILCDKAPQLGGLIRYSRAIVMKRAMERYMDYMIGKVDRLGIDVRLNTPVTPELVAEINPDYLFVAIGSEPIVPPIPGVEKGHMLMDVYDNKPQLADHVTIIGGGISGTEAAIELAQEGKQVLLVSMEDELAKEANAIHKPALMMLLNEYAHLITVKTSTTCVEIQDNAVVCKDKNGVPTTYPTGDVIIAVGLKALSKEANALRSSCREFVMIGDCKKPRQIRQAVLEGYDAATNVW